MDSVTDDGLLNTVFDDTIPQTPLNMGSEENASIANYTPEDAGRRVLIRKNLRDENRSSGIVKQDPDKKERLPIKFEQVLMDDLDDEELENGDEFIAKEKTITTSMAVVCDDVLVKQEIEDIEDDQVDVVESDVEFDSEKSDAEQQSPLKLKRKQLECSVCSKKYKNTKSFLKHEKTHNQTENPAKKMKKKNLEQILKSELKSKIIKCLTPINNVYTCTCDKEYEQRNSLVNCLKAHHAKGDDKTKLAVKSLLKLCGKPSQDGLLLCKKCEFTCETTEEMISHRLEHRNKDVLYECDHCDFTTKRINTMNRHKQTHNSFKPLKCKVCDFRCKRIDKLKHHERSHKSYTHKCDQCSFVCRLRGNMKRHAREEHGVVQMFYCDQCEYSGTRLSTLHRHFLVHQTDKPFACTECDYRCKLRNKLTVHMATHKSKPCKCETCGYMAQHEGALKVHKRTHLKKGIWYCDLCPYASPVFEYLEAHKNIHRGKRAFPCLECSYVSTHSSSFRRHLFTHSGEKPFACSICEFRACQENGLKIHMRSHSGERPYSCDVCDYSSSTAGTLKRHKLIHSPIVW